MKSRQLENRKHGNHGGYIILWIIYCDKFDFIMHHWISMEIVVDILYYGLYIVTSLILSCIIGLGILTFWRLTYETDYTRRNPETDIQTSIQSTIDTERIEHSELEHTNKTEPETTDSDEYRVEHVTGVLNNFESQKIALAVIGRTNMGKSTFINLIRDVDETCKCDYYAQTGFGDTTMEVTKYEHPKNENISLWDLPGLGTSVMPNKRFKEKVNLDVFDFFFIFLDSVVMEDDIWLVEQLHEKRVPFCFVRSKLDMDIANAKRKGIGQEKAIQEIKDKISKSISANDETKGSRFFLISNVKKHFHVGELTSLFRYLVDEINVCKIETLLFFLPVLNPDIIDMKYDAMKKRIRFVSTVAATVAAVLIPLIDIPINAKLIEKEVSLYIKVFGLDKDYVKKVPNLKHSLNSKEGFVSMLRRFGPKVVTMGVFAMATQADVLIPVVGSALAAPTSYAYVHTFLGNALNDVRTDALSVYKYFGQANTKP